MLHEKMEKALNKQFNEELYSSYLYLAMSSSCREKGLVGFSSWMKIQVQEELAHSMKYYEYIADRGGSISFEGIKQPVKLWDSPLDLFEATLKHERVVTGLINDLFDLSLELRDHATNAFLQWFISEQVEEEATAQEVIDKLKIAGSDGNALFLLDKELGQRVFVNPLNKTGQ